MNPGRLSRVMTFEEAILKPIVAAHRNPRKPRTKCVFCGKKVPQDEYYTNKHRNCYAAARQRGWRAGMSYSDFAKQAQDYIEHEEKPCILQIHGPDVYEFKFRRMCRRFGIDFRDVRYAARN
jgi:hypothetical protein